MNRDWHELTLPELFKQLIDSRWLMTLIDAAIAEDGLLIGDVTSRTFIPAESIWSGAIRARGTGRVAGMGLIGLVAKRIDQLIRVELLAADGDTVEPGQTIARVIGPTRSVLGAERTMLNFLNALSGIATLTSSYVDAVTGTKARIFDTRKTLPGYRHLAKYAVRCGGGYAHRMGLHDAVLIKDNHLAALPGHDLADQLRNAIRLIHDQPVRPDFIEIEVDRLDQLDQILPVAGLDIVLLDNMSLADLRAAVAIRDKIAGGVQLEASGGVTLDTVRSIAETGVDRIAIGALTHSAPGFDFGLDESQPV